MAETARISALLGEAVAARGGALMLCGEAGAGKTALLDAAAAQADGSRVLRCRGVESEAELPFASLHQLLLGVLDDVDSLPPVQARALRVALGLEAAAAPERFLVALAVLSLLAHAAERAPLLCIVDDAHWLDQASADTLAFVARRLAAEPIALLFATREADDGCGVEQLPVGGLDAEAAGALLDRRLAATARREGDGEPLGRREFGRRRLAPAARAWLLDVARGNPLALIELGGALTDAQCAGAEPILGPLPVSARVERAFLGRVRRLPPDTQTLLLIVASDEGGELTTALEAAARLGVGHGALDAAEEAGMVRVHGTRVELRHPLVRSAVYHGAPLSQRLSAHAALAEVLTDDRRAWHRAAASVEPDAAVVGELEQAAARARERGGYDAASLALERAAALTLDDGERARLLTAAAENAWLPGRVERARMLVSRARALRPGPELDRLAGQIELTCGVPADSCEQLRHAAAQADGERALELLSLASWGAAFARDRDAIEAITAHAERLALPESFLLTRLQGLRAHFERDYAAAAPKLQATLALADPEHFALASPVGLFLCDDRAILALHRRVAAQAREQGAVTLLTRALPWVALGEIWGGHWPAAAAVLDEGLELARATGQHPILAHVQALQGMLAALRGEEERCRTLTADALEQAAARRLVHVTCCATWALILLELGLGRAQAALAHARAQPAVEWDALDRVEAAARAGEPELARQWLEAFEPWAEASAAPWGRAVARHAHALLSDDAESHFRAALELQTRPFERARTELAYGEFLRRARRRTDSRARLRSALDGFEALGAAHWAERARTELRASGERSRKRDPSTLDELTAQEVQVAGLVAQGGTNRDIAAQLFLSPRTIDFHLRNVYRKLGISSRTELARRELAR